MTNLPPDPYALKAIETATKTAIELIHNDVKAGLAELLRIVRDQGKEHAARNIQGFEKALEKDLGHRVSIGVGQGGYDRIVGSASDPDFAYLVHQATIAAARTDSPDKHALLARAVTERLLSKPDSLVALASSLACQIIPNLTPKQLAVLGLAAFVPGIRPGFESPLDEPASAQQQQTFYLEFLRTHLTPFVPFPKIGNIGYLHLAGMSCLTFDSILTIVLQKLLAPREFALFEWPQDFFGKDQLMLELQSVFDDGLAHCTLTTVGTVIGTHVHDIKCGAEPTRFEGRWQEA